MAARLRRAIDLLRYLEPAYDGTPRLRDARGRARAGVRGALRRQRVGARGLARGRCSAGCCAAPRRPSRPAATWPAYLREQQADALLITPLIGVVGSSQPDYLRAARAARLPTAVAVWSWDHLTSKALIRDAPDRVHRVERGPARRGRPAARDRARPRGGDRRAVLRPVVRPAPEPHPRRVLRRRGPARRQAVPALRRLGALCRQPVRRPGSCSGGSPPSAASADPALRSCAILVRPHPQRMREWEGVDLSRVRRRVGVGRQPGDRAGARRLLRFAGLQPRRGRPEHQRVPGGRDRGPAGAGDPAGRVPRQPGGHAALRLPVHGGRRIAADQPHARRALRPAVARCWRRPAIAWATSAFIRAFLRPHGLDVPATPVFADAVEALAASHGRRPQPTPDAGADRAGRWILGLLRSHEPIAPVRPVVLRRRGAPRARVARSERPRSGRRSAAPTSTRTREPRPKRPCEPSGRRS